MILMIARRSDWSPRASLGKGRCSPATDCFSQTAWTWSGATPSAARRWSTLFQNTGCDRARRESKPSCAPSTTDEARVLLWVAIRASLERRELVARVRHPEREEHDLAVDRPDALRGRERFAKVLLRGPVDAARIEAAAVAAVPAVAHVGERDEPGSRERAVGTRRAPARGRDGGSENDARRDRDDRKEALHAS